jgi:hypothetical protein
VKKFKGKEYLEDAQRWENNVKLGLKKTLKHGLG